MITGLTTAAKIQCGRTRASLREWSSNRVSAIKQSRPVRSRHSRIAFPPPSPPPPRAARFSGSSPSFFAARRGSAGDERRTREVQTIDSARRCVGGAALSPGIVAARLLCRCFVTDRKVACLVCTNPTTSATIVRHVRDYSEKRSFDDKPASKVASPGRSSRSEPATQKFADRAFSPIDGPRGINERGEGKSAGDGDRRSIPHLASFRLGFSSNNRFDDVFFPDREHHFLRLPRLLLDFLRSPRCLLPPLPPESPSAEEKDFVERPRGCELTRIKETVL